MGIKRFNRYSMMVMSDSKPRHDLGLLLTDREETVLNLVRQRMPRKVIARSLGISVRTVSFHLTNAYAKTGALEPLDYRDLLVRIRHLLSEDVVYDGSVSVVRDLIDRALDA